MPDEPSPAAPSRAEREKMLADVHKLIHNLVRKCGLPSKEDEEDAAQEMQLLVWQLTEKFDPTRGAKFSSYAHAAIARALNKMTGTVKCKVMLQMPEDWDAPDESRSPTADEPPETDTEGQLFDAVRRQLTGGLLDALAPKSTKEPYRATLSERDLVAAVAFGGMTCAGMAVQVGQEAKAVRTRLKNAIRKLKRRGLTQHAASDAEVEAVLAPADGKSYATQQARKRAHQVAGEWQEPACPVPAEAADATAGPHIAA